MKTDAVFQEQALQLAEEAPGLLSRALGHGGSYADLFYERTTHHRMGLRQRTPTAPAAFRRNDPQVVEGLGVHVLTDTEAGFAATSARTRKGREAAAAKAACLPSSSAGSHRTVSAFSMPPWPMLPPDAPEYLTEVEKTALLRRAADAAYAGDPGVVSVEVAYQDTVRRVLVATSDGVLCLKASTLVGLRVSVVLNVGGRVGKAHALEGGPGSADLFFDHTPERVAAAAVASAHIAMQARPLPPQVLPVILAAGWGGVWLHEAVGHLLEADAMEQAGLGWQPGDAVAPSCVTLLDDATRPGGRATMPSDDEGTPTAPITLIEEGVLNAFLTDRRHARRLGLPPTGHGRRQGYRHPPLPRMTNLCLRGASCDPVDLIASVSEGLYVQSVGGGVFQPAYGFAFEVLEGYRIEQGRLTAPVTDVCLTGTGPDALLRLVGVADDVQMDPARGLCKKAGQVVPVTVEMPTVLISEMQVAPRACGHSGATNPQS